MAKLTEYPQATKFDEGDILIKDGPNGTKKILVKDAAKVMGSEVIMVNEDAGENTKVHVVTTDEEYELALMSDLNSAKAELEGSLDDVEKDVDELKESADELKKSAASAVIGSVAGGTVVLPDAVGNRVMQSVKVNIEPVQEGSGTPAEDNVRTLSGWMGAKIRRTAKNLWGGDALLADVKDALPNAVVDAEARTVSFPGSTTASHRILGDNRNYGVRFKSGQQYTFILTLQKNNGTRANLRLTYTDGTFVDWVISTEEIGQKVTKAFVTDAGKTVAYVGKINYSGTVTLYADECGLFEGVVTAEDFVPYDGVETDVEFPEEAGEVYGGVLDVTASTLTVNMVKVRITSVVLVEQTYAIYGIGPLQYYDSDNAEKCVSNILDRHDGPITTIGEGTFLVTRSNARNQSQINFRFAGYTGETTSERRAWVNARLQELADAGTPLEVVFPMTEPIVYQLTSAQIEALAGYNVVWADCGPVEIEYVRDTGSAIEAESADTRAMIGEASGETASRSLAVGEYVTVGDTLYRVTAAVGQGETLTPGINVTKTTVGAELTGTAGELAAYETDAGEELRILAEIADRTYAGRNLTAVFASEISQYSGDPWAWIKGRVTAGNYKGIHVGDWIPYTDTSAAPKTRNARIMGIDTYRKYGDTAVGHHIDFWGGLWDTKKPINKANYNNGTSESEYQWLASDAYLYANSLAGKVSSEAKANPTLVDVDYTADGIYYYLPDNLKAQIKTKRFYLEKRYAAGELLTESNAAGWADLGKIWFPTEYEVYGAPGWGGDKYAGIGSAVQYPFFMGNMNRLAFGRTNWWLLTSRSGTSTGWCYMNAAGNTLGNYTSSAAVAAPICFRIA